MSMRGVVFEAVEDYYNTGLEKGLYVCDSEDWAADDFGNYEVQVTSLAEDGIGGWLISKNWIDKGYVRIVEEGTLPHTARYIEQWALDRNLIEGSDPKSQFVKLVEEVGELASDIAKGNPVEDAIGDIAVVLCVIAKQYGTTLDRCMEVAYNEIKDRTGKMVDGVFIKEAV